MRVGRPEVELRDRENAETGTWLIALKWLALENRYPLS
jgi:hypothetical protein